MTMKHADKSNERMESALHLVKRIGEDRNAVQITPALLDVLADTVLDSRHICFTGLGGYWETPG